MTMNESSRYALTHAQNRIWYLEKLYPGTPLHNLGGAITFRGLIDPHMLKSALRLFYRKNDSLRLQFLELDGQAYQYFADQEEPVIAELDFSGSADPASALREFTDQAAKQPFALTDHPLYTFAVYRLETGIYGYFVKFHHLISDGWSMNLLTQQVCDIYMRLTRGEDVSGEVDYSFEAYIPLERQLEQKERFQKDRRFWQEQFAALPEAFLDKSSESLAAARATFLIGERKAEQIRAFARECGISLNSFFVALLLMYLNKSRQQDDVIIGTPVLNRSGKKERHIFGMFISMMPFRSRMDEDEPAGQFAARIDKELVKCFFHQKYPYELLVKDIDLHAKGYDQLFQVCVNYSNARLVDEMDGIGIENEEFFQGNSIYSLHVLVKDWYETGDLRLDLEYKVHDYTEEQIRALFGQLETLIDQIIANPGAALREMTLLSPEERLRISAVWNRSPVEGIAYQTFAELFAAQAARTPQKTALRFEEQSVTYGELDRRAEQLAGLLRRKGIGPDVLAAVMLERSVEMMVSLLAVLKAGGAYVPIDPEYPQERVRHMLEDSGARLLITERQLVAGDSYGIECLWIGELADAQERNAGNAETAEAEGTVEAGGAAGTVEAAEAAEAECSKDAAGVAEAGGAEGASALPEHLAYVIYTSGSTGLPKGVMISHKALHHFFLGVEERVDFSAYSAILSLTTISFDIFVLEALLPLTKGLEVVLASERQTNNFSELAELIGRHNVELLQATPSRLKMMLDNERFAASLSKLKALFVGGEAFPLPLLEELQDRTSASLYNMYGPTEATVWCAMADLTKAQRVHLGQPLFNTQLYIVDRHHRLQPAGVPGELCIAGGGLADGYLHQPQLTGERFIRFPSVPGGVMYKTGDLARWLEDGTIEYMGRIDQQVKFHGYRIELQEIEAALSKHRQVKEAAAAVQTTDSGTYLCAYYKSDAELGHTELRQHLHQRLPAYCIPSLFIRLEDMPLTPNGKIDRKALPKPSFDEAAGRSGQETLTAKEQAVLDALQAVLQLTAVNPGSNFYQLGGDSIKALQLVNKVYEQGIVLEMKDVLYAASIYDIAAAAEMAAAAGPAADRTAGDIVPTPAMRWLLGRAPADRDRWQQSVCLELHPAAAADFERLSRLLESLIRRHDSFRININEETNAFFYNEELLTKQPYIELVREPGAVAERRQALIREAGERLRSSFDLRHGYLMKACLFDFGPQQAAKLLLVMHRLCADQESWRLLAAELTTALSAGADSGPLPAAASLQAWAERLNAGSSAKDGAARCWKQPAPGAPAQRYGPRLPLRPAAMQPEAPAAEPAALVLYYPQAADLLAANAAYHTRTSELLTIALVLALEEWLGQTEICLELDWQERTESGAGSNAKQAVGCMTGLYPVCLELAAGSGTGTNRESGAACSTDELAAAIKELKEQLRSVPDGGLTYGLDAAADCWQERLIRFTFVGDLDAIFASDQLAVCDDDCGEDGSSGLWRACLFEIQAALIREHMKIKVIYDTSELEPEAVRQLAESFSRSMVRVVEHCLGKEGGEFTPSDFEMVDLDQTELDLLLG